MAIGSSLTEDSIDVYIFISDCEFNLGTIGFAEYEERKEVLAWLIDNDNGANDPRGALAQEEGLERDFKNKRKNENAVEDDSKGASQYAETPPVQFIPGGLARTWVFTIGDPDHYPSVPHGHLNNQNQKWPKLNPYSGRAFGKTQSENTTLRLSREEMRSLWNDEKFKQHALKQIAWYNRTYPRHRFPVPRHRISRLPKWR